MKAAVCKKFGEPLTIEDVVIDPPGPGEIGVKIAACAICHSDIHFAQGAWGGELPMVLGHEAAGEVIALGDGVHDFSLGDHAVVTLIRSCGHCHYCDSGHQVHCEKDLGRSGGGPIRSSDGKTVTQAMKTGAFAEQVTVHSSQAVKIPSDIPFASASLLACGVITGVGAAIHSAKIRPGQSAIVIGLGGVGLNALQGAAIAGADPIIGIDPQPSKRSIAFDFGATHTLDSDTELASSVHALTFGRGADHVLVTVGSAPVMSDALSLLAKAGTLTVVGMPALGAMADYEASSLAFMGQRIQGSVMGASRIRRDIPAYVSLYKSGRLKLDQLVSGTFALEDINTAIAEVKSGQVLRNVIVFS